MKIKLKTILAVGLLAALLGCRKEEIPTFTSDDAGIYFQRVSSYIYGSTTEYYTDSTVYSFAGAGAGTSGAALSVLVRTMGKVRDYDRSIKLAIDTESTTAVEGIHYEANLDTFKIKAGESSVPVRVRILRSDDMLSETIRLIIRLEDNEHFKCYLPAYKNTNSYTTAGDTIRGNMHTFSVSEKYTQPFYWQLFGGSFFGPWTSKKYIVVNEANGLTPYDWSRGGVTGTKVVYGRFTFFGLTTQRYLQDLADAGTPMKETDGSYMQLAQGYLVDYSKYE